jgi:hypothetical protein
MPPSEKEEDKPSRPLSHCISWSDLLKRTFQIDTICPRCQSPLRLIAMIKTADTIKKILSSMGLPLRGLGTDSPPCPPLALRARPSPSPPNSIPPGRRPQNLAVRVETGSTDGPPTRAGWRRLFREPKRAASGPENVRKTRLGAPSERASGRTDVGRKGAQTITPPSIRLCSHVSSAAAKTHGTVGGSHGGEQRAQGGHKPERDSCVASHGPSVPDLAQGEPGSTTTIPASDRGTRVDHDDDWAGTRGTMSERRRISWPRGRVGLCSLRNLDY